MRIRGAQLGAIARNWTVAVALGAAVFAIGIVLIVLFFTQALWPKVRLETEPPGATVVVDGIAEDQKTPLTVRVEPEQPHTIEFRLEGHRPERRDITNGVGRGRTYSLPVMMRRLVPTIFLGNIFGTVSVNGREVGRGFRVSLPDLPLEEKVKIHVEAEGYRPLDIAFDRGALVPDSLDVTLTRQAR
jgi:hypothetical protein